MRPTQIMPCLPGSTCELPVIDRQVDEVFSGEDCGQLAKARLIVPDNPDADLNVCEGHLKTYAQMVEAGQI